MPNELDQIIAQAKKQAQDDKFRKFLRQRKNLLIKVAIAATIVAAVLVAAVSVQNYRAKKFSEILHQSLISQQMGKIDEAQQNLAEVYNSYFVPGGIKSIASLRYAAFLLNSGENDKAIAVYQKLHSCFFCNDYAKDLAGLLVVKIWMSNNDEVAKPDLSNRIKKIEKSSDILKFHVVEQRALLALLNDKFGEAYEIFAMIAKEEDAFPALKERAEDGMKFAVEKGYEPKSEGKKAAAEAPKAEESEAKK